MKQWARPRRELDDGVNDAILRGRGRLAVPPPDQPDPHRRLSAIGAVMAIAGAVLLVAVLWTALTGPGPVPCCDPAVRPLPAPTVAGRRADPRPPDPQPWPSPGPWEPAGPRVVTR